MLTVTEAQIAVAQEVGEGVLDTVESMSDQDLIAPGDAAVVLAIMAVAVLHSASRALEMKPEHALVLFHRMRARPGSSAPFNTLDN